MPRSVVVIVSRFAAVLSLLVRTQDAGLIFLSAIASSVVAFSREEGLDEAGMLSTGEEWGGFGWVYQRPTAVAGAADGTFS